MDATPWIQIRQYNYRQILAFLEARRIDYRWVGDHVFMIRTRGEDVAAGPGDWLVMAVDGRIDVERGRHRRWRGSGWPSDAHGHRTIN